MSPYAEEKEHAALAVSDLFGNERFLKTKGRTLDERAGLVKYFVDQVGRPARFVGYRLAHLSLDALYTLRSQYADRLRRPCHLCIKTMSGACIHSTETARKHWWWATKTEKA